MWLLGVDVVADVDVERKGAARWEVDDAWVYMFGCLRGG